MNKWQIKQNNDKSKVQGSQNDQIKIGREEVALEPLW